MPMKIDSPFEHVDAIVYGCICSADVKLWIVICARVEQTKKKEEKKQK